MDKSERKRISVIIPTLNAAAELPELLRRLRMQETPADEIIVVDSDSDDGTRELCENDPGIRFMSVSRNEFDHGRTRDMALRLCQGDIVIFMTQDALPADRQLITKLTEPLSDGVTAFVNGRQLPKKNAVYSERLVRTFNYPAHSRERSMKDIGTLGIKTFSNSDVCAAYNKEIYLKLGGFIYPLKTNEDMFFAAKAIRAGYYTVYSADAKVFHSHNFTLRQQFKRNYVQGYELEKHKELLCGVSENGEGLRLVSYVAKRLLKEYRLCELIRFAADCAARIFGNKLGKLRYRLKK